MNAKESQKIGLRICEAVNRELVWLRNQQDISQREMARRGGMHWECVSGVERGFTLPTLFYVARAASGIAVPVWRIVQAGETGDRSGYGPGVGYVRHDKSPGRVQD